MFVRLPRQSVCLLTAIMLLSGPLLACSLPGMAMSEDEKECCRHMADQCGGSQMEDSHSCCKKSPAISAGTPHPTVRFSCSPLSYSSLTIAIPVPASMPRAFSSSTVSG